jgi:hypothetical protein
MVSNYDMCDDGDISTVQRAKRAVGWCKTDANTVWNSPRSFNAEMAVSVDDVALRVKQGRAFLPCKAGACRKQSGTANLFVSVEMGGLFYIGVSCEEDIYTFFGG